MTSSVDSDTLILLARIVRIATVHPSVSGIAMPQPTQLQPVRPEELVPDEFDVLCEKCTYSLIGLTCDRCPECGHPFDHTELPLARVPWLYRRRIGKRLAFARTWRMIVKDPHAFAKELCRPVRISQEDARLFRRAAIKRVVLCEMLIAFVVIVWAIWAESRRGMMPSLSSNLEPYLTVFVGYFAGAFA